jgi:hypothetical protein
LRTDFLLILTSPPILCWEKFAVSQSFLESWKMRACADLANLPKHAVKPVLQRVLESCPIEPHHPFDLGSLVNPDHARPMWVGERHRGDRAAAPMQFG